MLLPYFQPLEPSPDQQAEETVDPSRFLADTKNALNYYDESGASTQYHNVYLVGSDSPARHRLKFMTGAAGQANSPCVEELVAALACLTCQTAPADGRPVHVFQPTEGALNLLLGDLPWSAGNAGARKFALFLHIAAFVVRVGKKPMDRGILQFIEQETSNPFEVSLWPWAKVLLANDAGHMAGLDGSRGRSEMATYCLRLLSWAEKAIASRGELDMLAWSPGANAFPYWQALCTVDKKDGLPNVAVNNAPASFALTAAVYLAMTRGRAVQEDSNNLKLLGGKETEWFKDAQGPYKCSLPLDPAQFDTIRQYFSIAATDEYERTSTK